MNEQILIAIIAASSALLGGLIGGLGTALVASIQARAESRRQLVRLAAEIELEQTKAVLQLAASNVAAEIGNSSPAIVSHYRLLVALDQHGADSDEVKAILQTGTSKSGKIEKSEFL